MDLILDSNEILKEEFSRYLAHMPVSRAIDIARSFQVRSDADDVELIINKIKASLDSKVGMSFLRMGDGEGRFLLNYYAYPEMASCSKFISRVVWFSYSKKYPDNNFFNDLSVSYKNSSIIGYVPEYRINLEKDYLWYGYYGCANGNEFILDEVLDGNVKGNHNRLVRNWSNVNLFENKNFIDLLSSCSICIITCHNELDVFKKIFSNDSIRILLTPPEKHKDLKNNSDQSMYPESYDFIMNEIENVNAEIFIVSCGVFAKIFCEKIRSNGKISIDVGSVIDSLLGLNIR